MQYVDESDRFASLSDCPFGRRGSYLTVHLAPGATDAFGRAYVYLGTCHGAATVLGQHRLFAMQPVYQGERVPFAAVMKPAELVLRTLYGEIHLCIAEARLLLIRAENGLGLRFATTGELDRETKPRGKTAWETVFNRACLTTVIHPIIGRAEVDAPWDWDQLRCGRCKIDLLPDENGRMLASLEEFSHSGTVRAQYPTYEQALAGVQADFDVFLANIPPLKAPYESLRIKAAWNLWSFLVGPCGLIKRNMLYMSRLGPASQWQLSYQVLALAHNAQYAWDQLLVPFDYQSETGQLPDYYDDSRGTFANIRPPIQGWTLKQMRRLGYYQQVSPEQRAALYPKLAAWADWFDAYRVEDGADGLLHYERGDESGMEDGSTFRESPCMVTPDLPAYLVLLYEELGEMSRELGMEETVRDGWYRRAADLQQRLIDRLWDGKRFVSHTLEGKTIEKDYGILGYLPVLLGHRLPDAILSALVADLKKEGYILTEYGFDKEKVEARELCDISHNAVRGFIYQPFNLLLISALHDMGETAFASDVAKRFCGAMLSHHGLGGMLNAYTGAAPGEWMTWTAGAYLLIAGMIE